MPPRARKATAPLAAAGFAAACAASTSTDSLTSTTSTTADPDAQCANPLFARWLREWAVQARATGSNAHFVYKKAHDSLVKCPIRYANAADTVAVANIGPSIARRLAERMKRHIEETGGTAAEDTGSGGGATAQQCSLVTAVPRPTLTEVTSLVAESAASDTRQPPEIVNAQPRRGKRRRIDADADADVDISAFSGHQARSDTDVHPNAVALPNNSVLQPPAKRARGRNTGPARQLSYVPRRGSCAYAILVALHMEAQTSSYRGYMTKAEIVARAQRFADAPFDAPDMSRNTHHTGWSAMTTLKNKGLVYDYSNPKRYTLTDDGSQLAAALINAQGGMQGFLSAHGVELQSTSLSLNATSETPSSAAAATSLTEINVESNAAAQAPLLPNTRQFSPPKVTTSDYAYMSAESSEVSFSGTTSQKFRHNNTSTSTSRDISPSQPLQPFQFYYISAADKRVQNKSDAAVEVAQDGSRRYKIQFHAAQKRHPQACALHNINPAPGDPTTLFDAFIADIFATEYAPGINVDKFDTYVAKKPAAAAAVLKSPAVNRLLARIPSSSGILSSPSTVDLCEPAQEARLGFADRALLTSSNVAELAEVASTNLSSNTTNATSTSATKQSASQIDHLPPLLPHVAPPPPQRKRARNFSDVHEAFKFTPATYPPGSYEVCLVLDNREARGETERVAIQSALARRGVSVMTRPLSVGDAMWVARRLDPSFAAPEEEAVLDYIVERKRIDDLIGSIKDGRYHEQKSRLSRCGVANVIYIIEDHSGGLQEMHAFGYDKIMTVLAQIQVVSEFMLHRTKGLDDTIAFLATATKMIRRVYEGKPVHMVPTHALSRSLVGTDLTSFLRKLSLRDNQQYHLGDVAFSSLNTKTLSHSVTDVLTRQLMTIRGVSAEKSTHITAHYPTWPALMSAVAMYGARAFTRLQTLNPRKKIGDALAKRIHHILWSRDYDAEPLVAPAAESEAEDLSSAPFLNNGPSSSLSAAASATFEPSFLLSQQPLTSYTEQPEPSTLLSPQTARSLYSSSPDFLHSMLSPIRETRHQQSQDIDNVLGSSSEEDDVEVVEICSVACSAKKDVPGDRGARPGLSQHSVGPIEVIEID